MEQWWNKTDRVKQKNSKKIPVPVPIRPPQIPTWIDPGANQGLHGDRLVTNNLSHDTARFYTQMSDNRRHQ